jgi:hypothetical protein
MPYQLLFCTSFCGCLGNLKIAVRFVKIWVRSSAWAFFPSYFFYSFYQILIRRWDVDLDAKFQHKIQCFLILKKPFQHRQYFNISNWCDLAKEIFKRFLNLQNIEYLLTKKCYGAEILHRGRHLICGWEFDKTNKKSMREKKLMPRIEPDLNKPNGYFQIS